MRPAPAFFLLAALLLGSLACEPLPEGREVVDTYLTDLQEEPVGPVFAPKVASARPPSGSVLRVPPAEMLEVVRRGGEPLPDRRFLLAFAHVHHLVTGEPAADVRAELDDGRWTVHYGSEPVGELPELADVGDVLPLLREWIRRNGPQELALPEAGSRDQEDLDYVRTRLARFEAGDVAEAMRRIDERWREGARNAELARLATRGLVYLVIQSYDRLDVGDALPAQALAALALAQVRTDSELTVEEALLAEEMGYSGHARTVADVLPPDDPVRLYVNNLDSRLRPLAEAEEAAPRTRYLYALRLAERRIPELVLEWTEEHGLRPHVFGLAQLKPSLRTGRFETEAELAPLVPYVALYDLWKTALPHEAFGRLADARIGRLGVDELGSVGSLLRDGLGLSQRTLATRFERDLLLLDHAYPGPFLDAATYRAYFTGHFYSGMWKVGRHLLDGLASGSRASQFVASLEGSPPGIGAELHRWYLHLAEAENGRPDVDALRRDVLELRHLGEEALGRSYDEVKKHLDRGERRTLGAEFARRLDTRPSSLLRLVGVARLDLRDLNRWERYRATRLRTSPDEIRSAAYSARLGNDADRLLSLARDPRYELDDRVYALSLVPRLDPPVPTAVVAEVGDELIRVDPDEWETYSTYARILEDRGDYEGARRIIGAWLDDHSRSDGFPYIFASSSMARVYQKEGRLEEAWRWIEPVMGSHQNGAMGRGALVLEYMGRHASAREWGARAVERYPGSAWARSVLAEILWRQGAYDEVAPVLDPEGYPITLWNWRQEFAEAFVRAFADKPDAEALAAQAALERGGVSEWTLEDLSVGLSNEGRTDLAFAFQSKLRRTESLASFRIPLWAHGYLQELRGEEEALAWLRERIPARERHPASVVIFDHGDRELLWTLVDDPEAGPYPTALWLLRAAAWVDGARGDPGRRRTLLDYYRNAPDDDYALMGRYLMGLADEETLLARATTPDRRCEIAFYLGLRAKSEGRVADAVDWFRVAVATGQRREGEYHWAAGELRGFANAGTSLAVQEARLRSGS